MARSVAGGVEFHWEVSFEQATFMQLAAFQGIRFTQTARFDRATFAETAQFTDSRFNALVTFDTAPFEGVARFVGATFRGEPNFTATTFRQLADFHDATLPSDSNLGPCTAHHLNVSGLRVSGPLTIQCRMFQEFTATNLHCADKLNLQLDGAIIVDATAIRSAGSLTLEYKHGDLTVCDVAFDSPSTLRKVDATNLTLAGLRLDACRFSDCHNRDSLRIEGPPQFASTPDEGFWTNRQVLAEEHLWRARYDRRPRGWFPDTSWHPDENPPERWGFSRTEPEVRHEAALIQSIYRDLRKGREDAKDEPGAADFYFGEMEMRRMAEPPRSRERALLTAYWAVSGYGLRATRALVALLFVLVLGTVGFATVGFAPSAVITYEPVPPSQANQPIAYRQINVAGSRPGWSTAIDHTIDSATSLLRATTPRPLTWGGRIIEVALRLLGPLLLGLAVLALRTRVKR